MSPCDQYSRVYLCNAPFGAVHACSQRSRRGVMAGLLVGLVMCCTALATPGTAPKPNVAAWVTMRTRVNASIITPACDLVCSHLPKDGRDRLVREHPNYSRTPYTNPDRDVFVVWAGGNDLLDNFYTDQDVWTLTRVGDTEVEWNVLGQRPWNADNDPNWPPARTGAQGFCTQQGDFFVFGGYSTSVGSDDQFFFDDMVLFSTRTLNWTILQPRSAKGISNPGPIARAWASFAHIPTPNNSKEEYFLHGGQGTYDGDTNGKAAIDFDDNWILDFHYDSVGAFKWEWKRVDNTTECTQPLTICGDARSILQQSPQAAYYIAYMNNITNTLSRPADFEDVWSKLDDMANELIVLTAAERSYFNHHPQVNNQSTCREFCEAYAITRPQNFPVRAEGSRAAVIGDRYFLIGGYNCTERGVQSLGGTDCYHNSVYIYHLKHHFWKKIMQPKAPFADEHDERQSNLWPSKRAYHTLTAVDNKLWLIGGAYEDGFSVWTYYNDVHVFNVDTLEWEEVIISGTIPAVRWSACASLVENQQEIWYYMGCTANQWFNDVHTLLIGRQIEAQNLNASGAGIVRAVAGEYASFQLQTKAYTLADNDTVWGRNLAWGVGLASRLDVHCVGSSDSLGELLLYRGIINERGEGGYTVKYRPQAGSTMMRLFVQLDGEDVPGSPFSVQLIPASVAPSKCQAFYMETANRNGPSPFYLYLCDNWFNIVELGAEAERNLSVAVSAQPDSTPFNVSFQIAYHGNGTYELTYWAPDWSWFWLHVMYNGIEFEGSPFEVEGLDPLAINSKAVDLIESLVILAMVVSFVLAALVWRFRNEVALKVATPVFLEFMLLGGCLALSSIFFLSSKTWWGCRAFPLLASVGTVVLLGSLYIKTYRLMVIFRQKQLRTVRMGLRQMTTVLTVLVGTDVAYNCIWLAVAPLDSVTVDAVPFPLQYLECSGPSFSTWAGVSYLYKGMFLFYGVFLAVMTRGLPSAYGEAAYIGLAIYNIAFSASLALPIIYLVSSQDTLTAMFVLTSLAIIWTVVTTYFMLIVPRLYNFYKQIAPEKRFLDEMGYDAKRGTYDPRFVASGKSGKNPFASPTSSRDLDGSKSLSGGGSPRGGDGSKSKSFSPASSTNFRMDSYDMSSTHKEEGLLDIHASLYNGAASDEELDAEQDERIVLDRQANLTAGVHPDDANLTAGNYVALADTEMFSHTQKPHYERGDVVGVSNMSTHEDEPSDGSASHPTVAREAVGGYVPPTVPPFAGSGKPSSASNGAAGSGKYSGLLTMRASLEKADKR